MSLWLPPGVTSPLAVWPMAQAQVRWFLNGKAFLRHLADLGSVRLAAYCQTCYTQGLADDVMAAKTDTGDYVLRCAHRQRTVTASSVRSTDDLLARLGWSLRCAGLCAQRGMFDGVEGFNDPNAHTVSIRCGCTDRRYAMTRAA